MTPKTVTRAGQWLAWALVLALPWLGLGLVQRQALGPLHVHASALQAPADTAALPGYRPLPDVAERAWAWWWAQVRAQTGQRAASGASRALAAAHTQGVDAAAEAQAPSLAQLHPHPHPHPHPHAAWQRHHHDPVDDSVLALDAAPDDAGAAAAASLLLLVLGSPASSLRVFPAPARPLAWPRAPGLRFSSRNPSPPLRPPRG